MHVVFCCIKYCKLAPTYSPPEGVPSVLRSLTSVFGMRTGGPSSPKHQLTIFNFQMNVSLTTFEYGNKGTISENGVGVVGFEPTTSKVFYLLGV